MKSPSGRQQGPRFRNNRCEPRNGRPNQFFASHHAVRAETVLKRNGLSAQLIPGPKELSPNCGVALRFFYADREQVVAVLAATGVRTEGVHLYRPRTDAWNLREVRRK